VIAKRVEIGRQPTVAQRKPKLCGRLSCPVWLAAMTARLLCMQLKQPSRGFRLDEIRWLGRTRADGRFQARPDQCRERVIAFRWPQRVRDERSKGGLRRKKSSRQEFWK
jgi:hypothetical protein